MEKRDWKGKQKVLTSQEEWDLEVQELGEGCYEFLEPYKGCHTKIKVRHLCDKCDNFEYEVTPNKFRQGRRCPWCSGRLKLNTELFKRKVKMITNDEYTVLGEYKGSYDEILMRHEKCGTEFLAKPNYFITPTSSSRKEGSRCPICSKINQSEGSKRIEQYLISHGIKFTKEKRYKDCKNIQMLPFDFYVVYNGHIFLIEFDGEQHFEPYHFGSTLEDFEQTQINDGIKNKYCEDNNLNLLRISYKEINKIDEILDNYISQFND